MPVKVTPEVLDRFYRTIDLLEPIGEQEKNIKPFMVFGFDVFNAGTTLSKFGGIVGIPVNFTYKSAEDINKYDIQINNEFVNWGSDEANQLLDSLILSENAQHFAIAREISTVQSLKPILNAIYGSSILILMYEIGHNTNHKFNLFNRPLSVRCTMYSLISLFGFGIYVFLKDFTQNYYDKKIDQDLCEKNPVFVEGGKEFYEKLVQRNIALRKLMGPYGERRFTPLGNNNYWLRQKTLPIVTRRDFFLDKVENFKVNV